MRRRNWLRYALLVMAVGFVLVAGCLGWNDWNARENCYNRIQEGRPVAEAFPFLDQEGYQLTGGDWNPRERVMVFTRRTTDPAIVLIVKSDGRVAKKEYTSALEHFYDTIRRHLRDW